MLIVNFRPRAAPRRCSAWDRRRQWRAAQAFGSRAAAEPGLGAAASRFSARAFAPGARPINLRFRTRRWLRAESAETAVASPRLQNLKFWRIINHDSFPR